MPVIVGFGVFSFQVLTNELFTIRKITQQKGDQPATPCEWEEKNEPLLYITCPLGTFINAGAILAARLVQAVEQNW